MYIYIDIDIHIYMYIYISIYNSSDTIFLNTHISLLHLGHVDRAASLTVHCCWMPRHHHRGELLLPTVPPPEWSTYDVTVRARNLACTEPYMYPACTAIQVSF